MNKRQRRMLSGFAVSITVLGICTLVLYAFRHNINLYFTPSELLKQPDQVLLRPVRLGGLVAVHSLKFLPTDQGLMFRVTDNKKEVVVRFKGLLPSLFHEGRGVIAEGRWMGSYFYAKEVLAKHDENYRPPKVGQDVHG
jgi:cytochrome c-type biogenesis protein CcmE